MKEKIKLIIAFIIGIMISVVISVYAATVITGKEVSYTDNKSIGASNVQDAIDNTYTAANTLASNVTSLETRTTKIENYLITTKSYSINYTITAGGNAYLDISYSDITQNGYTYSAVGIVSYYTNNGSVFVGNLSNLSSRSILLHNVSNSAIGNTLFEYTILYKLKY